MYRYKKNTSIGVEAGESLLFLNRCYKKKHRSKMQGSRGCANASRTEPRTILLWFIVGFIYSRDHEEVGMADEIINPKSASIFPDNVS